MIAIIGLGNPGKKFLQTRHNLGFIFLDSLKRLGEFSSWQSLEKFEAKISEGRLFGQKVLLVKPQTFMNNSGKAVLKIKELYNLSDENIWVVHDDIHLELGRIKISRDKSAGGHKGIESIIQSLKTKSFVRFRIGIGPKRKIKDLKKFVLGRFSRKEKEILAQTKKNFFVAIQLALKDNIEKAMTEINKN